MTDSIIAFPIQWVRLSVWCALTGEVEEAIYKRIASATWAAGKHYKRIGARLLWINLIECQRWIEQQPHVEALCPKASRSVKARAEAA